MAVGAGSVLGSGVVAGTGVAVAPLAGAAVAVGAGSASASGVIAGTGVAAALLAGAAVAVRAGLPFGVIGRAGVAGALFAGTGVAVGALSVLASDMLSVEALGISVVAEAAVGAGWVCTCTGAAGDDAPMLSPGDSPPPQAATRRTTMPAGIRHRRRSGLRPLEVPPRVRRQPNVPNVRAPSCVVDFVVRSGDCHRRSPWPRRDSPAQSLASSLRYSASRVTTLYAPRAGVAEQLWN